MSTAITVMSFNIRGAYWKGDGVNYWPQRAALNVAMLERLGSDVIGFQEFQDGNMEIYARSLAGYHWSLGPRYGHHPPFEYPAIAWRPERLRLCGSGGFWLSETPERHSESWQTACIRSAQWARFQSVRGGPCWLMLNTHLDHESALARLEGTQLILRRLQGLKMPGEAAIITGDFNCDPDTPPYAAFQQASYQDTFVLAGDQHAPSYTYHGFHGSTYKLKGGRSERIDWILTQGMQPRLCEIVRDEAPPRYPSDHYPVLAWFEC